MKLREQPELIEAAAAQVAAETAVPLRQVRKDFWLTEILRAASAEAAARGGSAIFKGGTSLSKVFGLIERFSEDVDVLVVGSGGPTAVNTLMKAMSSAAANHTGIEAVLDTTAVDTGRYRAETFGYPGRPDHDRGMLLEMGSRGGALPNAVHRMTSLIGERFPEIDGESVEEAHPFEVAVLSPARTLVEKLVILHEAATRPASGRSARIAKTVRHYYDVCRLLGNEAVRGELAAAGAGVLAREVCQHSKAIGLPSVDYPTGGFGKSPAFLEKSSHEQGKMYDKTMPDLLWPDAKLPTFQDCLASAAEFADLL